MLAMKKIANDNGIKDKKIKSLQYQLEHYSKRDTLILRDTVFKDPNFVLDTCIIDRWNKSCLHLQYPGTIALSNEYENEKFITLSSHREPIKPRKWFLPRWFTKKQTVVEVLVVDENPYVKTKFVIDICKLTLEEKGKLQEDLFGVGAYWSNSQRVIIEEGTDNSVGYYFIYPNRRITYLQKDHNIFDFTFDRIVDKDTALNLLRYRIFLK